MDDIDTMWLNTAQEKLQTERYGLARALTLTMAWNQHNHPSVILWSLQNESEIDPAGAPVYRSWLADLKAAVKSVDLTARPVTWASNTSNDPAFDLADVSRPSKSASPWFSTTARASSHPSAAVTSSLVTVTLGPPRSRPTGSDPHRASGRQACTAVRGRRSPAARSGPCSRCSSPGGRRARRSSGALPPAALPRTGPFAAAGVAPSAARAVAGQAGRATKAAAPNAVTTARRDGWVESVMSGGSSGHVRSRSPHSLDNPVTLVKDYS
ncbi:glycoside hydrolase family 2 TIM barrel-domain containing protein [Streptomyces sp. NPDC005476]|uniref:glycoside hydrolase family 2 TIM barrel-domain containing protein n=1 Tax=Streptomyces sp. NPDC005476 TaxID=3156882 RepID=UPI0034546CD4